uniref:Ulp1 protease family, C-terminal catalytic domain-containing protein n=1 Tax=Neospora caninum (strain Liverpool) TaxID=572307 RepID=A0A0F7UMN6_NEOCL|nr:TPA: Ulp1 protease family, C-terminal catalytic domain-containing protein [Neospora caninum Liverpool]
MKPRPLPERDTPSLGRPILPLPACPVMRMRPPRRLLVFRVPAICLRFPLSRAFLAAEKAPPPRERTSLLGLASSRVTAASPLRTSLRGVYVHLALEQGDLLRRPLSPQRTRFVSAPLRSTNGGRNTNAAPPRRRLSVLSSPVLQTPFSLQPLPKQRTYSERAAIGPKSDMRRKALTSSFSMRRNARQTARISPSVALTPSLGKQAESGREWSQMDTATACWHATASANKAKAKKGGSGREEKTAQKTEEPESEKTHAKAENGFSDAMLSSLYWKRKTDALDTRSVLDLTPRCLDDYLPAVASPVAGRSGDGARRGISAPSSLVEPFGADAASLPHAKAESDKTSRQTVQEIQARAATLAQAARKPLEVYRSYAASLQEKLELLRERERRAKSLLETLPARGERLLSALKVPPPPPLPLVPVRWNRESPMRCDAEALAAAQTLLTCSDPSSVLIDKFNIGLAGGQLECLYGSNWLNDEVINFYMQMLQERNEKQRALGQNIWKTFFFNTFFYAKLTGGHSADVTYDYASVRRWTRRQNVDIFAVDLVLIPLHVNRLHWTLGVVDMRKGKRKIYFFDSLGGKNKTWFLTMRRYLQDEHTDKHEKPLEDIDEWCIPEDFASEKYTPQQANGFDCGVFICQMAECIADGRSFDFSQKDIPRIRHKMALQIVGGELDP